jgi:hypothetical protein
MLRRVEQQYPTSGHFDHWEGRIRLPSGAEAWDYLVVRPVNLETFPVALGAKVGTAGEYLIIASLQATSPDDRLSSTTVPHR